MLVEAVIGKMLSELPRPRNGFCVVILLVSRFPEVGLRLSISKILPGFNPSLSAVNATENCEK